MSLESPTTGEPSRYSNGEGRREGTANSRSSLNARRGQRGQHVWNRGSSQGGKPSVGGAERLQAKAQVGRSHEAAVSDGGLGVPGEGEDLHPFQGCNQPSGGTCLNAPRRSEGDGDGRPSRKITPHKVRKLQMALYRKAEVQRTVCLTNFSSKMNGFGKLDAGNPHVQFDEGSELAVIGYASQPAGSGLLYYTTVIELAEPLARRRGSALDR